MHYFIDGYNLLFRCLRAGDNLKIQRQELIQELAFKCKYLNLDVTLVFDSHYQEDDSTRNHLGLMEIVFTAIGESADEYILKAIKYASSPKKNTVVTSDKKLAALFRLRQGLSESVEEFNAWIKKRCLNKRRQELAGPLKNSPLPTVIKVKPINNFLEEPNKNVLAKECFNFYLQTFEKIIAEQKIKKIRVEKQGQKKICHPRRKYKSKVDGNPISQEDLYLSNSERWMKAFDREINEVDLH